MDEKYIVQFVTLLGAAVTSIFLAIRVYNKQTDIVRALVILLCVIILFYIIGKIFHKTIMKIRDNIAQKERDIYEAAIKREEAEADNDGEVESGEDTGEYGNNVTQ